VNLESRASATQSTQVALNIVGALSSPFGIEDHRINIGASLGISLCPDHASDTVSLLRNADMTMSHAKGNGKNNFYLYAPEMECGSVSQ
jgi:predicted signal transduction protein with EAL and GGDEF domain